MEFGREQAQELGPSAGNHTVLLYPQKQEPGTARHLNPWAPWLRLRSPKQSERKPQGSWGAGVAARLHDTIFSRCQDPAQPLACRLPTVGALPFTSSSTSHSLAAPGISTSAVFSKVAPEEVQPRCLSGSRNLCAAKGNAQATEQPRDQK